MILYIGVLALIITIITIIWLACNEHKMSYIPYWNSVVVVFIVSFLVAVFTLVPAITIEGCAPEIIQDNVNEYTELILYKSIVEESDNEYLRWNYYEKVVDWNRRYDANAEKAFSSFWFGPYQRDYFIGTQRIEFELRGDE